jgi:TatD DNase family protein
VTTPVRGPEIIDTHAHLDDPAFDADRDVVFRDARDVGVVRVINIGYCPERWRTSSELRERFPEVEFTIGIHPQIADRFDSALQVAFEDAVAELKPVALGEMGFDFFRDGPSAAQQERAFRAQLEVAMTTKLPVVIHQRNAVEAVLAEIDRWPGLASIVLHSFDGNSRLMDWALERDCYFGIGGLATKLASEHLRALLKHAPVHRLLLETDAPYLAPPGTKDRRNVPSNLPIIAHRLAPLWGLTGEELCQLTADNASSLFGLGRDDEK